jgi:hypothetical protein
MTSPTRSWTTGLGIKAVVVLLLSMLLVSCGSSKKYNEFIPTRILSVGDAMSYMSFDSSGAVNLLTAGDPNNSNKTGHWLWTYAGNYGLTSMGITPATGTNLVFFNNNTAYPAGPTSSDATRATLGTETVIRQQLASLFAATSPQTGDLVILSIGMGDIFALADSIGDTATVNAKDPSDPYRPTARAIGLAYANLADSIYQRGFKHVLLVPAIDYSTSPYVATKSATYKNNIAALTELVNLGLNVNCNGGCSSSLDSKPYPSRAEGVWKFDAYNYLYNIAIRTATYPQFDNSKPVCYIPGTDPVAQTCVDKALYNSDTPSLPYYYAGDLFTTPVLHTMVGNYLYAISRGFSGF